MANYFDQFDGSPAILAGPKAVPNFFDQYDTVSQSAEDLMIPRAPGADSAAQAEEIKRRNGVLREVPHGPRFGDILKPAFGGHNPIAETYDAFVDPFIPSKPRTQDEADLQAFQKGRTFADRAKDAGSFAASLPVRMATQGQYGAGDALSYFGFPGAGQSVSTSEEDFNRANAPQLEALAKAGSVGAGTMGLNIPGRVQQPRVPRDHSSGLPMMRATETARDLEAFDNLGVRPFGPAFSQGPVTGVAKSLSDTPMVGAPVRNALEESIRGASKAADDVASRYGEGQDARQAGLTAQEGLHRYRDARPQDIIDTRVGNLDDAAIDNIIGQPAAATSLKTKQAALYERAWRFIPEEKRTGKSTEGEARVMGNPVQTRQVIDEIVGRNARMTLQSGKNAVDRKELNPVQGGLLKRMVEAVQSGKWTANYQTMRDMRSEFRRLASGMNDTERNTLRVSDMERIQSAITRDMIAQLERNAVDAEMAQNHGLASRYRAAVDKFSEADTYTRRSMERLETIERLFNANSVESLAQNITRAALDKGRGNQDMLKSIRHVLRPEEMGDIASSMIRELGRPVASAKGIAQEVGFSVASFSTRWKSMTPEAKKILFEGEHAAALDDLARVTDRLANVEAMANTSRSGTHATNIAGISAAGGSLATGDLTYILGAAGAGYGASLLLSRPAYAKWAVGYAKLRARAMSGPRAVIAPLHAQVRKLRDMAKTDPALIPLVSAVAQDNGLDEKEFSGGSVGDLRGGSEQDRLGAPRALQEAKAWEQKTGRTYYPGVPSGLDGEPGPDSIELDRLKDDAIKRTSDRSLLHYENTQIVPNNFEDLASMGLEGLNRFGEVSLAFGPMGEALNAPLQAVGAAARMARGFRPQSAAEKATAEARDAYLEKRGAHFANTLAQESKARHQKTHQQGFDTAARSDRSTGTVPDTATAAAEREATLRGLDGVSPRAIPGHKGLLSKSEQIKLIEKYFDQGGKTSDLGRALPWGRNPTKDAHEAVAKMAGPGVKKQTVSPEPANLPSVKNLSEAYKSAKAEAARLRSELSSLSGRDREMSMRLRMQLHEAQSDLADLQKSILAARKSEQINPSPRVPPKIFRRDEE